MWISSGTGCLTTGPYSVPMESFNLWIWSLPDQDLGSSGSGGPVKTSAVEGDDKGRRHRLYYASFWAPHQRLQSEMETGSTLLQLGSSCDCQSCLPMIGHWFANTGNHSTHRHTLNRHQWTYTKWRHIAGPVVLKIPASQPLLGFGATLALGFDVNKWDHQWWRMIHKVRRSSAPGLKDRTNCGLKLFILFYELVLHLWFHVLCVWLIFF